MLLYFIVLLLFTNCIQKNQYSKGCVQLLLTHTVEFFVNHDNAAPVRCTLTWELITFKQLLENLHMDLHNGYLTAQI